MKVLVLFLTFLISSQVYAGTTRSVQADEIVSADKTKTFTLPSSSGGLCLNDLSNLSSVSIGAVTMAGAGLITPFSAGDYSLGSDSLYWNFIYGRTLRIKDGSGDDQANIESSSRTLPSGASSNGLNIFTFFDASNEVELAIYSFSDGTADANPTGSLYIETGDKTAGTGNSGSISHYVGSASGGASGDISFTIDEGNTVTGDFVVDVDNATNDGSIILQDGSQGTVNHFIRQKATTGAMEWAPIAPSVTADPCGDTTNFPEGTLFYNDTSDYFCFCNGGGNDVQMHSPATACF